MWRKFISRGVSTAGADGRSGARDERLIAHRVGILFGQVQSAASRWRSRLMEPRELSAGKRRRRTGALAALSAPHPGARRIRNVLLLTVAVPIAASMLAALQPHGAVAISANGAASKVAPVAEYISNPPTWWRRGVPQRYEVHVTNRGRDTWGHSPGDVVRLAVILGGESNEPHEAWAQVTEFTLPSTVAPGATVALDVEIVPTVEGDFTLRHRALRGDSIWSTQQEVFRVTIVGGISFAAVGALLALVLAAGSAVWAVVKHWWDGQPSAFEDQ